MRCATLGPAIAIVLAAGCRPTAPARAPEQGGGIELTYATTATELRQHAVVELTSTGGGDYAKASLDLQTAMSWQGRGDRIEVAWAIVGVDAIDLAGKLAPAEGETPAEFLVAMGRGGWVVDARGAADAAASAALQDNQALSQALARARRDDGGLRPGAALLELVPDLLALPRLPGQPMNVGQTVQWQEDGETVLEGSGVVVPTETTAEYTLVKVDAAAGGRIAEVKFDVRDYGSLDGDDGSLQLEQRAEGTLLFDLDARVPVSLSYARQESLTRGDVGYDTTKIVQAEFAR